MKQAEVDKIQAKIDITTEQIKERSESKTLDGQLSKWDAVAKQIDEEEKLE